MKKTKRGDSEFFSVFFCFFLSKFFILHSAFSVRLFILAF